MNIRGSRRIIFTTKKYSLEKKDIRLISHLSEVFFIKDSGEEIISYPIMCSF